MCPVRLFAQWWIISGGAKGGYVFRKKSGNRFSADPNERMVSMSPHITVIASHNFLVSRPSLFWTASETTSVIYTLTLVHTALTHSAVEVANILPWFSAGPSAISALGEVGQRTLTTPGPSSNICSPGLTRPCSNARIISIQTVLVVIPALHAVALVIVHKYL
jgi:hypothetical protein